jgi:hypothetical protein
MIAPVTMRSCGPELATMPGSALRKKPRISLSSDSRKGAARLPLDFRKISISNCSSPAMPTVAAMAIAAVSGSCRHTSSRAMTAIRAMLKSSGENAVNAKRCCAFSSPIMTVTGPAKGQIGQHQSRIVDGELQRRLADETRGKQRDHERHRKADQDRRTDQRNADGAEHTTRKSCGCDSALRRLDAQPGRNQRRIQRALGEQPPDHVDELKCYQKSIRDRACAEQRGDHRVAGKAQQPRCQSARGNGQDGTDHRTIVRGCPCWRGAERDSRCSHQTGLYRRLNLGDRETS